MKTYYPLFAMLLSGNALANAQDAVVYSQDFCSDGATAQGWIMTDANGDGLTWKELPQLKGIAYNSIASTNAAEDWLFTPTFEIESGKHYLVTYTVSQRGAFEADNISIFYGDNATVDAMNTPIVTETYNQHSGMVTRSSHITATTTGQCVIGMKLVSAADNGIVVLKSISVTETIGQCPQAVPAMDASVNSNDKTVKLRWINSKRDAVNASMSGTMNALIYEDDNLVATVEGMIPGEKAEYIYTPAIFSGKHTYAVAMQADEISASVSKTIDLDDTQGTLVPVYTFPMVKASFSTDWTVENKDGGNTWEYYAKGAYIMAYGTVNDWLISPEYTLEPGKRYVLTYKLSSSVGFPSTFDITMGTGKTSTAQTTVIASYVDFEQNGMAEYTSPQFEVSTETTYYFGIHATRVGNSLDVKDVTLNYVEESTELPAEEELTYTESAETVLPDNDNAAEEETHIYHSQLQMEGVSFRAVFTQALIDEYTLATNGVYNIPHDGTQYKVNLSSPIYTGTFAGGCVYNNGLLYCNEYDFTSNIQTVNPVWRVVDAKTFEVISENTLNSNCENTTIALAYDPTTDKMYGFVKDYVDTYLVQIDRETGAMTRMTGERLDYNKRYLCMSCDRQGNLYCIYMTEDNVTGEQKHYLSRINKATGQISDIGQINPWNLMTEDILFNMKYRQALFFNNNTGKMYWMMCSSSMAIGSEYAAIFEVNPVNANATLQTWLTDVYAISGAYFEEPPMEAPGVIEDFTFIPDSEGATTGQISFKIPGYAYNSTGMTSPVTYTINEPDGDISLTGTVNACDIVTRDVSSTQGVHTLNIQLSNKHGEGPMVQRSFLIGYDMPEAPGNVVLTDTALVTTLRWTAPAIGIYGKPFDKSKLTYEVVRYPDALTVAKDITDTIFVESHGEDLLRYYYVVYSCIDGERSRGVVSNDVVVGSPLYPPYGGVFKTLGDMNNYYTILDVNNDIYTWAYDSESGAAFYPYNWQQAANDWLISPPIYYEAGKEYLLTFSTFSSSAEYPESMLVTFGKNKTPEGQSITLLDLPEVPGQDDDGTITTYQLPIIPEETDVYYYGFKAYSAAYQEYLFLYYITLEEAAGVSNVKSEHRNFDAYAQNGNIYIINPEGDDIAIYGTNGAIIDSTAQTGYNKALTPGIYIVKSSTAAIKVAVR